MPGALQRAGNLKPGPRTPATGLSQAVEGQSLTTPAYPGAIDDVGTSKTLEFVDDSTVLVSLFTNFLGAVVEAIQAEVGPLATVGNTPATWVAGSNSLQALLDKISLANNAGSGQLIGIKRWQRVSTSWAGQQVIAFDAGYRPPNTGNPVVFCYSNRNASGQTLVNHLVGPVICRGWANWTSGSNISVQLSSAKTGVASPGPGLGPTGSAIHVVEGLVFFMPEGNPNA